MVTNPFANAGDAKDTSSISGLGRSPGGRSSSILACKIPWTEEPGRLQSVGSQRVRHSQVQAHACAHTYTRARAHTHTHTHTPHTSLKELQASGFIRIYYSFFLLEENENFTSVSVSCFYTNYRAWDLKPKQIRGFCIVIDVSGTY